MDNLIRKCALDRKILQLILSNKSLNSICKELKVGKRRVQRVMKLSKEIGYLDGKSLPEFPQSLFGVGGERPKSKNNDDIVMAHKDWIIERLVAGWKVITIFEEFPVPPENFNMCYSTLLRSIKRNNFFKIAGLNEKTRVVPEIITAPGEVLQLDWGKLRDVVDPKTGKKKTLWALVGVLGHSRYMMVKLVWENSTETTLAAIQEMFTELGGVPARIVSDNPKCFSIEASYYEPNLNVAFERFCSHYNIIPEILPPRSPKLKGKVERLMPYVRRLYEGHGDDWDGIEESQNYLNKKIELANERKHGTTRLRPIDVLLQHELAQLKRLPPVEYEIEEYHYGKVRSDGHVRFRNKYYSLDEKFHGKEVFIIGNDKKVEIYYKCELIETHHKITANFKSKSTKEHHRKPWEQIESSTQYYLDRAKEIGEHAEELIQKILSQGQGYIDFRKIWGVLSLDKDYEKSAIDTACEHALTIESYSYITVKNYLQLTPKRSFSLTKSQNNKFIRDADEYSRIIQ